MIRAVPGSSIAATTTSSGSALRRFAQTLRVRHVLGRSCGAALRWALLLAVPVILVAWLLPSLAREVGIVCLAILIPTVAVATLRAWWQSRRIFSALRESLANSGEDVAALHDELLTWLEFDHRGSQDAGSQSAMLRWLEHDVQLRLQPHRARALAAVTRPQLGRWQWLVPTVLLLLLIWLVAVWLAPPWSGAVGGQSNQSASGNGQGDGDGGGTGGGSAQDPTRPDDGEPHEGKQDESPDPAQPQEQAKKPDPPPPPKQPEEQPKEQVPPPDPEEIPPLIELPPDQRLVVPDFIGDGPTRRARMHAAELEEQAAGSPAANNGSSAAAPNPDQPEASEPNFERAAEAAQRSRHVPPAERAMVRRFFDKLRAEANK